MRRLARTRGSFDKPRSATRRPYHTVVLALMVVTSSIAMFDLYLFASSGLH
ncbi:MAG: hypothetical protein ACLP36_10190 [Acidimicrobiales bacterium]